MYWDKKNKSWIINWSDPKIKGRSVKKRMPKGTTKEYAKRLETRCRSGLVNELEDRREKNFAEWSDVWIDQYASIHKTPSSVVKDRSTLKNHLIPRFGDWFPSAITVSDIQTIQTELIRQNFAPQSVNNVIACLSMILGYLATQGVIGFNPCKLVKRVRRVEGIHSFWTFEEVEKFMRYCKTRDYQAFQLVGFALTTGLRPGELQGLLRDSLDFESGFVHVKRNYCTKTNKIVEYTKTKRSRTVPVPKEVLNILYDKIHLNSSDRIFDFSCNSFGKRIIQKYAKECGVKPIRFHDLRHTFASHLALKNVHQVKIRDLLGHTKLDTTNIYMHLSQDDKKGLTDILTTGMGWASSGSQPQSNVISLHR